MSANSMLVSLANSTAVSLNTKVAGSVTSAAGLVINVVASSNVEWDSLCANVSVALTTSTMVVATRWEGSNDNSTWLPIYGINSPANVAVAAAGTGGAVTTAYIHACPVNPAYRYMRLACVNTVATGGATDIVTISYNWRRRNLVA